MKPRITIAMIGGFAALIGTPTIWFGIYIGGWVLARAMNTTVSLPAFSILNSFKEALHYFPAGFISGWIVAPYLLRRLLACDHKRKGFVSTGLVYGGAAGLLCSWLAVLISISELTISGLVNGKTEDSLRWTMDLFGYYASLSMFLITSLATVFGAAWGSLAEWSYRRFFHAH